ncbi:hypothetical protein AB4P43_14505, partial [Escherichia coli]
MATNKRTLSRIGFYCGLALFLIITLFPFFVMLMTSFKGAKEAISLHPTLLPQQWTLEHYVDIFNPLNLQSKCNKKRSTHQLEYNFVSTQKPFPNDEYFLPTSYNKRA